MAGQTIRRRAGRGSGSTASADGIDDIARGNVGTADQGPGDVYPDAPVTAETGELPLGEASPPIWPWTAAVKRSLAAGSVVVADPVSGRRRAIYAHCPLDGHPADVRRVVRGPADAVVELTMRCAICGHDFRAAPEELHLR
jgi:hypothetical protein